MTTIYGRFSAVFAGSAGRRAWLGLVLAASVSPGAIAQPTPAFPIAAQATAPATSHDVPILNRAQIDAYLAQPDKVLFIDVRRADEISSIGGLPAFLSIQLSELDRFLSVIPKDRQIVAISNHAHRAVRAGNFLAGHGFNAVGAVGVEDYRSEGGTLTGQKLIAPVIPGVTRAETRIDVLREGLEGTEGPIALKDGSVLFTENRADRIVRIAPDGSVSTYIDKSGGANALALNAAGEIVAVQTTAPSRVALLQPTPKVLASAYQGKPFNRLNDLAVARAGDIYFTDPGAAPQAGAPPAKTAVYWLNRKGKVNLVADDVRRPNGVALSPDEKTLYVANTAGEYLIAFDVQPDGSLKGRRDFAKLDGFAEGQNGPSSGADGLVVDAEGRVYVATSKGVQIFTPDGEALGTITLPKAPQNLAFGGTKRDALYVVGRGSAYRIPTLTHGVDRPGK